MAAFDRIKSGIPEMDRALDNIRLGDNVVWRVPDLDQFRLVMEPYVRQAIEDKRNIIYFRFASHEPLLEDRPEINRTTTSGGVSSHTSAVKCRINCCFRVFLKRQFIRHIIDVSRRFWSGS